MCPCQGFQAFGESSDEMAVALTVLSRNPAFSDVPAENLLALGSFGRRRLVMKGEILLAPAEASEHLYLILRGRVAVNRPAMGRVPKLEAQIGPGEIVGEVSLPHGARHTVTVTALEDLHVLELSKEEIQEVFRDDRRLLQAFLRMVHARLSLS
jgi:NTE family protein